MRYFKTSIIIFSILAITRFIPHPPNFTSLIALSFYVPVLFGIKFIPIVVLSFAITDIYFGFHNTTFFTWGSVILISLTTKYMHYNLFVRFLGAFSGATLFFIITNFGVWFVTGTYEHSLNGLMLCYTLAIPFFYSTVISTILFSTIFEIIIILKKLYKGYFKQSVT